LLGLLTKMDLIEIVAGRKNMVSPSVAPPAPGGKRG
jgi:hypothetical protein